MIKITPKYQKDKLNHLTTLLSMQSIKVEMIVIRQQQIMI